MRFANYNMFGLPDYNNTEIPSIPYSTIRTHTQEILKVSMPSSWCSVFQFHSHETLQGCLLDTLGYSAPTRGLKSCRSVFPTSTPPIAQTPARCGSFRK